jgi:hypothetical protein
MRCCAGGQEIAGQGGWGTSMRRIFLAYVQRIHSGEGKKFFFSLMFQEVAERPSGCIEPLRQIYRLRIIVFISLSLTTVSVPRKGELTCNFSACG